METLEDLQHWYCFEYGKDKELADGTLETYYSTLEKFKSFFGPDYKIRKLTGKDLNDFKDKAGGKNSTIKQNLDILKTALLEALKKKKWISFSEWIDNNPFNEITLAQSRKPKTRVLSEEEEALIYQYAPAYIKPIITIALCTGLRVSDILSLKWSMIDRESWVINIVNKKTGIELIQPIIGPAREEIKNLEMDHQYLFPSLSRNAVSMAFKRCVDKSQIKKLRFHDLRHTFCSRLAMGNVPLVEIAELAGHTNIQTTRRYSHLLTKNKKKALETLERNN
mgnify:CR=1 FL=1